MGERGGERGMEEGASAKPGDQLVILYRYCLYRRIYKKMLDSRHDDSLSTLSDHRLFVNVNTPSSL